MPFGCGREQGLRSLPQGLGALSCSATQQQNLSLCPGALLGAVQGAPTGNTPVGVLEEDIRHPDFLFLLVFQNWKPLLPCFLVCFWFGFCLGWFWGFFLFSCGFFCFFIFALVWSLFISPCPPYHLLSVTWISSELMFSDLFFIAKTLRILTQIRKL